MRGREKGERAVDKLVVLQLVSTLLRCLKLSGRF